MLPQIAFFVIAVLVLGLVLIHLCDWDDSYPPDDSFKDKDPDWWYGDDNDRH